MIVAEISSLCQGIQVLRWKIHQNLSPQPQPQPQPFHVYPLPKGHPHVPKQHPFCGTTESMHPPAPGPRPQAHITPSPNPSPSPFTPWSNCPSRQHLTPTALSSNATLRTFYLRNVITNNRSTAASASCQVYGNVEGPLKQSSIRRRGKQQLAGERATNELAL